MLADAIASVASRGAGAVFSIGGSAGAALSGADERSGDRRTVTLAGDHKPADLAAAVRGGAAGKSSRSDRDA